MKREISVICFDMWGTLCPGGGQRQWDELQINLGAASVNKKTFIKLGEENLLMRPWSLKDGIKKLAKSLKLRVKKETIDKAYRSWWKYVKKSKPYPEVRKVLNELHKKRVRLFIISNTDQETFNFKIKKLDWKKYFEKFFLSAQIGSLKPCVKVFETVQRYLSVPKSQIIMIDDSFFHGVYPTRKFGWKALLVKRPKKDLTSIFEYL